MIYIPILQEIIFPRTFKRVSWRKNKRIVEEVMLFGDLIDRMRSRIQHGIGFAIDDEHGTASTQDSEILRHGAGGTEYVHQGIVHGGFVAQNSNLSSSMQSDTLVAPSSGNFVRHGTRKSSGDVAQDTEVDNTGNGGEA